MAKHIQEGRFEAMNEKYKTHFLMNTETVLDYTKEVLKLFPSDDDISACEIGDGNINYVFRVFSSKTGKSIVIKQADKLLRSSGRPLSSYRSKIEAEILKIQKSLAPAFVPEVYNYDENMCAIAMEDISSYNNMRFELMKGNIFPNFADQISSFISLSLLPTTDLVMNRGAKKENVKLFINKELCDISEDLVFTEPYYNYKNRNIISEGQEEFVRKFLYENIHLQSEVGKLRDKFMNSSQALIHGDLHTGSIFINNEGIKIIDPEFAFYGPIGYDIGNVIAHLFFSWAYNHHTNPKNTRFTDWIKRSLETFIDLTFEKLCNVYSEKVSLPLYSNIEFKNYYIKQILADSIGYAGTEIIRRVVGDSKTAEITSMEESECKIAMERSLIKLGISLITDRECIFTGNGITERFAMILS